MRRGVVVAVTVALAVSLVPGVRAQRGQGAAPAAPPPTPQAAAPIDVTGYWVSIVTEDWRWRMVTPPKGDVASVPLNAEGTKVANSWDPATDGSCLAYGAAGLMRIPTRLHVTWENERTIKIETDAGQQTRRLMFDKSQAAPAQRTLQGFSLAEWEVAGGGRGADLRAGLGGVLMTGDPAERAVSERVTLGPEPLDPGALARVEVRDRTRFEEHDPFAGAPALRAAQLDVPRLPDVDEPLGLVIVHETVDAARHDGGGLRLRVD